MSTNITVLELIRLVVFTIGLFYVVAVTVRNHQDLRTLRRLRGETRRARINFINGVLRIAGMLAMWSVSVASAWFPSNSWPPGWVVYAQSAYLFAGVAMVLIARNIRKAQT